MSRRAARVWAWKSSTTRYRLGRCREGEAPVVPPRPWSSPPTRRQGHAARVAEEVLTEHADRIASVVIVPSGGGRFVVTAGDQKVFDKKDVGRFPEREEVARLLAGTA